MHPELPDEKFKNPECEFQNPENSKLCFLKSRKNPERS